MAGIPLVHARSDVFVGLPFQVVEEFFVEFLVDLGGRQE
jgi:hypothetical protein